MPLPSTVPYALVLLLLTSRLFSAEPAAWWQTTGLHDLQGHAVAAPERWFVAVFLDPECPIANSYIPVMNTLCREFSARGFRFAGIYTDPNFTTAQLEQHARDFHVVFPPLDDRTHTFARRVGATYSAEVVVLGTDGVLLYRGRIDDRIGAEGAAKPTATRQDLRDVLARLVAGERGPFPASEGFGCSLSIAVTRP